MPGCAEGFAFSYEVGTEKCNVKGGVWIPLPAPFIYHIEEKKTILSKTFLRN